LVIGALHADPNGVAPGPLHQFQKIPVQAMGARRTKPREIDVLAQHRLEYFGVPLVVEGKGGVVDKELAEPQGLHPSHLVDDARNTALHDVPEKGWLATEVAFGDAGSAELNHRLGKPLHRGVAIDVFPELVMRWEAEIVIMP
jgi:hypothetical protein